MTRPRPRRVVRSPSSLRAVAAAATSACGNASRCRGRRGRPDAITDDAGRRLRRCALRAAQASARRPASRQTPDPRRPPGARCELLIDNELASDVGEPRRRARPGSRSTARSPAARPTINAVTGQERTVLRDTIRRRGRRAQLRSSLEAGVAGSSSRAESGTAQITDDDRATPRRQAALRLGRRGRRHHRRPALRHVSQDSLRVRRRARSPSRSPREASRSRRRSPVLVGRRRCRPARSAARQRARSHEGASETRRSGRAAARPGRRHGPAAPRVPVGPRADPPLAGDVPARGDLRDARGDRDRRPRRTCARSSATCCSRCTSTPGSRRRPATTGSTIDDVAGGIADKLVYRHPHVFAGLEVADADEVDRNWDVAQGRREGARLGARRHPRGAARAGARRQGGRPARPKAGRHPAPSQTMRTSGTGCSASWSRRTGGRRGPRAGAARRRASARRDGPGCRGRVAPVH